MKLARKKFKINLKKSYSIGDHRGDYRYLSREASQNPTWEERWASQLRPLPADLSTESAEVGKDRGGRDPVVVEIGLDLLDVLLRYADHVDTSLSGAARPRSLSSHQISGRPEDDEAAGLRR